MLTRYRPTTTFVVGGLVGFILGSFFRGPVYGVLTLAVAGFLLYLVWVWSSDKRTAKLNHRLERLRGRRTDDQP